MECGIVGLPGTGKTSLFEALTGVKAVHAGGAGKPNIGIAHIPDPRLDLLADRVKPRKITQAAITFVDIVGIDPGGGAARSGPVLAAVREVEALCEVVRCFGGAGEPPNPGRDIRALADELILADLAVAEAAVDKAGRAARGADAEARARLAVLEKLLPVLSEGRPAREAGDLSDAERVIVRGYGLMSAKPLLYVANIGEEDLPDGSWAAQSVHEHAATTGGEAVTVCADLERQLAELEPEDRREMLDGLGLTEPAIGPLARAVCRLLGLTVFYTAGEKEVRAWTVEAGATAPQAAGVIHTDMQRGFIRAECYHVDDMVELGSEKAIKSAGKLRTEGKGYEVHDGDVLHVLFNV